MNAGSEQELENAISDARERLDAFDADSTAAQLLYRLRTSSPLHPFLLLRWVGLAIAFVSLVGTLGALVGPFLQRDMAELIGHLDEAAGVPMFAVLAMLVVCSFAVALGGHFASIAAGRSAPLLPDEAKRHQRLVADLQQLEAQRAVWARISPMGAEPRVQPRIDRRW